MGKQNSEVENEVYRFIKILIGLIIVIFGIYFFTNKVVNKPYDIKKDSQKGEVSTHNIIAGSLLNRPYKEYYVMAFNSKSKDAIVYETYINTYESKDKSLNVYILDLDNSLNKKYVNEKSNPKAAKIEDLQIKGPTLMKVNDGKIEKYLEDKDSIKKELGL